MYRSTFGAKGMKIVFVSSDRDEESFKAYFGEQPWAALPYGQRGIKEALSKKFKVRGIPSLVILDAEGKTITTDGREAVSQDPEGANFPWKPPTAEEKAAAVLKALGPDLVAKAGGKPMGLYFSAHWCPPCRGFTPKLAEFYKGGLKDKMEIIFVSSDREQQSFDEYFGEMPWLALPFESQVEKEALSKAFGVSGIPSFVVVNPDGSVITLDGRSKVMSDPSGLNFPQGWLPQPFNDVNDDPSDLNKEACVIALGGDEAMCSAVKIVAEEYYTQAGKDIAEMPFRFFSGPDGSVVSQVRTLTKTNGAKLLLLDIPDDGGFYVCHSDVSNPEVVREFLEDYKAKKLER